MRRALGTRAKPLLEIVEDARHVRLAVQPTPNPFVRRQYRDTLERQAIVAPARYPVNRIERDSALSGALGTRIVLGVTPHQYWPAGHGRKPKRPASLFGKVLRWKALLRGSNTVDEA
jgi:hypothetical protein